MSITIDELNKIYGIETLVRGNPEGTDNISGVSIDSRTINNNELFFAIRGERFDGHNYVEAALEKGTYNAVVEKKYAKTLSEKLKICRLFLVDDTIKALQELANIHRNKFNIPIIAVTGTNGKTTTKEMTADVLSKKYNVVKNRGNFNNHIGMPLSLLSIDEKCRIAVIEIGANHTKEIGFLSKIAQPDHGIITNVGAAHLEFFGSVENVAEAKAELLENIKDTGIINGDDKLLLKYKDKAEKVLTFGLQKNFDIYAEITNIDRKGCCQFKLNDKVSIKLRIPGKVNVYNALAASAAGLLMNVTYDEIKNALENFKAERQRFEIIDGIGTTIINDSYNANPDSMRMAIQLLKNINPDKTVKKIAVLGDMLELGDFSEDEHKKIGEFVFNSQIDYLFTFGRYSEYITKQANSLGMKTCEHFDNKEKIAEKLKNILPDKYVLLLKGSRGMKMEEILQYLIRK